MNYQTLLNNIYQQINSQENKGELASYIPELARVNPNKFGISLQFINGETYQVEIIMSRFQFKVLLKFLLFLWQYH
jgi:glutaminase